MFKHILVPLDGSEHAEEALATARELASRFDSDVTLLRVVIPADGLLSMRGYAASFVEFTALSQHFRDAAKAYLLNVRTAMEQQGLHVNIRVVEDTQVSETILRAVQKLGADTIVMTTHGHGGFRRWLLGSVAQRVVHQATVPVVLIRGPHDGG